MDILSIGNSFSQDAQRYLNRIAKADGVVLNTFNLFIGGCSLSRHYRNMLGDKKEYFLYMNGESTGFYVSIKEALLNRDWDVVTVQQASLKSPYYETYQPYLNKLVEYIKLCSPKAEIAVHETWAYEENSQKLNEQMGYAHHTDMYNDIKNAYKKAYEDCGAKIYLPSGELMQKLIENGIEKVHRDSFHLGLGIGRYAAGLLWYKVLTGNDVMGNTFCDFDEEISKEDIEIIKKCVMDI